MTFVGTRVQFLLLTKIKHLLHNSLLILFRHVIGEHIICIYLMHFVCSFCIYLQAIKFIKLISKLSRRKLIHKYINFK